MAAQGPQMAVHCAPFPFLACPYKLLLGRVFRNIITCATGRMYQLSTWDLDGEKYGESPYKTDALDAPKA